MFRDLLLREVVQALHSTCTLTPPFLYAKYRTMHHCITMLSDTMVADDRAEAVAWLTLHFGCKSKCCSHHATCPTLQSTAYMPNSGMDNATLLLHTLDGADRRAVCNSESEQQGGKMVT